MLTFLFWNLAKAQLQESVARLAHSHNVDIVVVVECAVPAAVLVGSLNELVNNGRFFFPAGISNCSRVQIASRFEPPAWHALRESKYYTLRLLRLPARPDLILGGVHLPSRTRHSAESQFIESTQVADAIRSVEMRQRNDMTILLGDFNMNPFEPGMLSAAGFHAVSSREIARRGRRKVLGTDYPFFYNPMWGHLGDRFPGPAGTYYYSRSEQVTQFWHVFDQFLVRPGLAEHVLHDSTEILEHDGRISLVGGSGRPRRTPNTSDHLPLRFSLDI